MAYYPAWFDYVAWLLLGCGAICGFSMRTEPASRKRGLLKLCFCTLFGLGIGFLAVGGVLFNLRAPHLTAEGTLFDVVVHHGRSSSTTFRLSVPSGEIDDLSLSGAQEDLLNGEVARVIYQDGSHTALNVQVLEGPNAGDNHTDSDGLLPSWIALFFGLGLASYGVMNWLNDGTAVPSPSEEDNQPAPDGAVDTKSTLDLS